MPRRVRTLRNWWMNVMRRRWSHWRDWYRGSGLANAGYQKTNEYKALLNKVEHVIHENSRTRPRWCTSSAHRSRRAVGWGYDTRRSERRLGLDPLAVAHGNGGAWARLETFFFEKKCLLQMPPPSSLESECKKKSKYDCLFPCAFRDSKCTCYELQRHLK